MGHYLIDFAEIINYDYVSKSRDLILHHIIAITVFSYHTMSLRNFPWITMIYYVELSSFFLRANLVIKYHDADRLGLIANIFNIGNFVTIVFRFVVFFRLAVFFFEPNYSQLILIFYFYAVFIMVILIAMVYLGWTALRYMILNDLIYVKKFFSRMLCCIRK
jgi:hypothetical protein